MGKCLSRYGMGVVAQTIVCLRVKKEEIAAAPLASQLLQPTIGHGSFMFLYISDLIGVRFSQTYCWHCHHSHRWCLPRSKATIDIREALGGNRDQPIPGTKSSRFDILAHTFIMETGQCCTWFGQSCTITTILWDIGAAM